MAMENPSCIDDFPILNLQFSSGISQLPRLMTEGKSINIL